jgi:hypothetical protein
LRNRFAGLSLLQTEVMFAAIGGTRRRDSPSVRTSLAPGRSIIREGCQRWPTKGPNREPVAGTGTVSTTVTPTVTPVAPMT